jgi:hypothetical protein
MFSGKKFLLAFVVLVAAIALATCSSNGSGGGGGGKAMMRVDNNTSSSIYNLVIGGVDFGTVPGNSVSAFHEVPAKSGTVTWTWMGSDYEMVYPAMESGDTIEIEYGGGYDWDYDYF